MDKALSILLPAAGRRKARRLRPPGREIAQKLPQVIAIEQELARTQRPGLPGDSIRENLEKNWLPCGMGTWPPSQTGRPSGGERLPLPTIWRSITSAPNAATPASVTTTCATACAAF